MLGFGCNFKCRYCLQHQFKNVNQEELTFNNDIIEFIKKHADKIKEYDKDNKLQIQFFGGEPLVYYDIIKKIVYELKDYNVCFSMITNGSLITDEVIDFLTEYNIGCGISWDGRNTKLTRLVDVFETNKENIFKLKELTISGVVSSYTYPKEFIEDISKLEEEFLASGGKHINFGLDPIYDFNNSDKELYNLDLKKIENEMRDMAYNFCFDQNKNSPRENEFMYSLIQHMNHYKDFDGTNKIYPKCMNGYKVLNLDLKGNLYLCHNNVDYSIATIYDSKDFYEIKYKQINPTFNNYTKKCYNCEVRFICDGGCMLVSEEERDNFYCKQQKAFYTPVIETLLEFGSIHNK